MEIKQTFSRQLAICLRFSDTYPNASILIELKSKTLSTKVLSGLTNLSERHAKEFLGKPQAFEVIKFISNYLQENPLCIVYDEIFELRKLLINDCDIKLKQKQQSILLTARGGEYYFKIKVFIPDEYPLVVATYDDYVFT